MKVAYLRVSTEEQNEARQRLALENVDIEHFFIDKMTGKNTDRPQFKEMISFVRSGDELYISELSRLSRDIRDLLNTIEILENKNVKLISCKENIDTGSATGRMFIGMIAVFNQFERELIHERTMAGIEAAKQAGKYKGRQRNKYDEEMFNDVMGQLDNKDITVSEAARKLKVTRQTIYNILKSNI